MFTLAEAKITEIKSATTSRKLLAALPVVCTWNVVKGRQRFGAEVDGGRPLPHLLHEDLPLLLLQQLHEELMRRHHKHQGQVLQAFTESPAPQKRRSDQSTSNRRRVDVKPKSD